jgi:Zn-finger nucleic acid-binding protein
MWLSSADPLRGLFHKRIMRLLVACPQCKRQFDAGSRAVGSRFRCHCGAVVTVQQPSGHDAAVVRCSSCGAPREEGSTACRYCGADFTIHEQDLATVCPGCLARVSDRAKFCHHCGVALLPETLPDEKTPLGCPACGKGSCLGHRQIGEVALLECQRCGGFWVGRNVFEHLVEEASHGVSSEDVRLQSRQPSAATLDSGQPGNALYRQCPVCGELMNRYHYAHRSGVIIDSCRDHGVWFDADELANILAWVRSGGKAQADQQAADDAERQQRLELLMRLNRPRASFTEETAAIHELGETSDRLSLAGILAEIAARLFK